ncbi:MAG: hypothetical protein ABI851_16070 [Saprospiraceae bacterium]
MFNPSIRQNFLSDEFKEISKDINKLFESDWISYKNIDLKEIPPPIYSYLDEAPNAPFIDSVKLLKKALLRYHPITQRDLEYKYLHLALCYYYLRNQREFYYYYNLLINTEFGRTWTKLLLYLKYDFFDVRQILILVSVDYEMNNNYFALKYYYPKIRIEMFDKYGDKEKFFESFKGQDLVFIIGHGGDKYIYIGGEKIDQTDFANYINKNKNLPNVLGIFSCNQLLDDMEIIKKYDYYVTDTVSFPGDVECFIFGFIRNYHKGRAIKEAFWSGRIAPFLRTKTSPPFIMYERGELVNNLI